MTPAWTFRKWCSRHAGPRQRLPAQRRSLHRCTVGGDAYDQAGALLRHIYGEPKPRVDKPQGQIVAFDQRDCAGAATSRVDAGCLYVPPQCAAAGARR